MLNLAVSFVFHPERLCPVPSEWFLAEIETSHHCSSISNESLMTNAVMTNAAMMTNASCVLDMVSKLC